MSKAWQFELRLVLAGLAACGIVGWTLGRPFVVIFAGLLAYLVWQLVNLRRLLVYLDDDEAPLPPSAGVWSVALNGVRRIRARDRRRRERLRKTVDDFRQAAAAMPDAAVILRDDGEIVWLNRSATGLLGLRLSQDIDQPIVNLIRTPEFVEYMEKRRFEEPLQFVSPVDENIRLLLRVVPYGADRNLLLARDVTRLHRLEQIRKDFVGNVSHELRSPLTVIIGYLETLRDDHEGNESLQRPLEQMWEQAERMRLIVDDLLKLSRIENQPGGAPKLKIPVPDMLARIRADAAKLSNGAHEFHLSAEPQVGLLGEHNELYSAFSNLVLNAVQYTPSGGRIEMRWSGDDSGARLEVIDTGTGIEAHHIPRLTERFYRVDKARSRQVGGTGLGLAIVKHVLMRHDATLEVDSEPGKGSRFVCRFSRERTVPLPEKRLAAPEG